MCTLTWGGYLGLSPSCLEGLFHFTACPPPPHPPPIAFPVILALLPNAATSHRAPKSLFSLPFHPSTLPSSISLSFAGSALLCSALTLSSLARVFSHAYSVLDTEFYCHSVYTQVLWESGAAVTPTARAYALSASNLGCLTSCVEANL